MIRTEGHCNHCILVPILFYPAEKNQQDCIRAQDIPTAPTGVTPHFPLNSSYDKSLLVLHGASSPIESPHTQVSHVARLVQWIQPLQQQGHSGLQQAKQDNFFYKESSSP
jgi:hypothetical protein